VTMTMKVRAPTARAREQANEVHRRLSRAIPEPHVELDFQSPWQLLVAVILSAQSTDRMVNKVMPEVLRRWPIAAALARAPQEAVETVIKSTGFFRNKSKSIRAMSAMLMDKFGGVVPRTMDELLELPGVARKTANVVLGTAYGVAEGITVDTHAMRVAQRLRFTRQTDPVKIETQLCALFPREAWIKTGHRLVLHGRHVCTARKPDCARCPLNEVCPSRAEDPKGSWEERAERERLEMESRGEPFSGSARHQAKSA
jgi:endonuclease III